MLRGTRDTPKQKRPPLPAGASVTMIERAPSLAEQRHAVKDYFQSDMTFFHRRRFSV
jgi:hypothetical protein